jgi:hypothetical protein
MSQNGYLVRMQAGRLDAWFRPPAPLPGAAPDSLGWYALAVLDSPAYNRHNLHLAHTGLRLRLHLQGDGLMPGNPCYVLNELTGNPHLLPPRPSNPNRPWEADYATAGPNTSEAICLLNPHPPTTLAEAEAQLQAALNAPQPTPDPNRELHITAKPVVYLYPDTLTAFTVTLQTPPGAAPVCYPALGPSGTWRVQATPGGLLTDARTGRHYPSLFWEAHLPHRFAPEWLQQGWLVPRQGLIDLLDAQLDSLGFWPHERTEFVQYWLPILSQHDSVFLHFAVWQQGAGLPGWGNASGAAYVGLAPLLVSPAPATVQRVLLHWLPATQRPAAPPPVAQRFAPFCRTGGHALEWGGTRIAPPPVP